MFNIIYHQVNANKKHNEMPLRILFLEKNKQKITSVSERMQRNQNPCALLMRMKNGAAALENRMAIPQKIKHDPAVLFLSMQPKEIKVGT